MKCALLVIGLVTATLSFTSCQNNQSGERIAKEKNEEKFDSDAAEKDAQLVVDLTTSNYAEIEMAKVAQQKSENKEIKDLAEMLETDHTMLVNQLKEYGANKNISLPNGASEQAIQDSRNLAENNKPATFDKTWCSELLDKHEKTISKLESAANSATDPDLKAWINNALPKVRMHRDKLMECNNSLK